MGDTLDLKKSQILIYGTGGNGRILCEELLRKHYNVLGFIDKRAKEIVNLCGRAVYAPDDKTIQHMDKSNVVLAVTIKNVFSHSDIVRNYFRLGFCFFIYKPLSILNGAGDKNDIVIDTIYNNIIEDKIGRYNIKDEILLPKIHKVEIKLKDSLFIRGDDEFVYAWLPAELLFNYKEADSYAGLNMSLFFPLVDLYRCFMGDTGLDITECKNNFYLYSGEWADKNGVNLDESLKNSLIESRYVAYIEMQKRYNFDRETFFIDNAPIVKRDDDNRFYMKTSGRNRVTFQIARGNRFIPVKMTRIDYDAWVNTIDVNAIEQELEDTNNETRFAMIPHPYMTDLKYVFPDYQSLFLQKIAYQLLKKIYVSNSFVSKSGIRLIDYEAVNHDIRSYNICSIANDDGCANTYFKRIGFTNANSYHKEIDIDVVISDFMNIERIAEVLGKKPVIYVYAFAEEMAQVDDYLSTNLYEKKEVLFERLKECEIMQGCKYKYYGD